MIPTTKPTRLLNANNNTTATIIHRHRAPTQSTRTSVQSRDSSPEFVIILRSLLGTRSFDSSERQIRVAVRDQTEVNIRERAFRRKQSSRGLDRRSIYLYLMERRPRPTSDSGETSE